ncbi:hypothetical protein DFH06DRAFT_1467288 [Mycena polygramma]|nr:hypothetical protein DFH06DRAFT_1467288 [Mycena polygramma]
MAPAQFPRISIVNILGKGKGVIANEHITRGTLIVSEKPRIYMPQQDELEIMHAIVTLLPQDDMEFVFSFPPGPPQQQFSWWSNNAIPCFNADGRIVGHGLYPTICRVNHKCRSPKATPNAVYSWNYETEEEELRALKDIHEGQEIEVTYLENVTDEEPLQFLQSKFGFVCSCPGCTRPIAEREASHHRILTYLAFMNGLSDRFREHPLRLITEIEQQLLIICEEGYTGQLRECAHAAFRLCAYYGDLTNAQQWAAICRDTCGLYFGKDCRQFKELDRLSKEPQTFTGWHCARATPKKLIGPSQRVLRYSYPKVEAAPKLGPTIVSDSDTAALYRTMLDKRLERSFGGENEVDPDTPFVPAPPPVSASATTVPKLSKGQKKKAKARAKKAEDARLKETSVD